MVPARNATLAIAADLGGTKLAVALVDVRGRVRRSISEPTELSDSRACLNQLIAAIQRAKGWARGRATVAGISVPGLVRRDGTVWAPNLPGWKRMPVARAVARATGLRVAVESDRNASVLGESWRGAASGATDAVFLIVGTGIGAGILSGGRLVRGADELSGCAGWLAVAAHGANSRAAVTVLEPAAAGPAIAAQGAEALGRAGMTAREVFTAARQGRREARAVIERAAFHLGLAVANIISLFNPQVVVLGGGVGVAGELLLTPLRRTALRWAQPLAARRVRIVASRLRGRAPLLGAARLAFDLAIEDNTE